jgi:hypothetical protein
MTQLYKQFVMTLNNKLFPVTQLYKHFATTIV